MINTGYQKLDKIKKDATIDSLVKTLKETIFKKELCVKAIKPEI